MARNVQDVILHTNEGLFHVADQVLDSVPPPDRPIVLADDLLVTRLDSDVANAVMNACEPPGHWKVKPVRQYAQMYTFVKQLDPSEEKYEWDPDSRLESCVALSRLVHPTSVSLRYAARVFYEDDGSVRQIVPADIYGHATGAWYVPEGHRDWLTSDEFSALRDLMGKHARAKLPPRVSRALWFHEYAARDYYLDVRWTLISTALEALAHTDKYKSTSQFVIRTRGIAKELKTCRFTKQDARRAYHLRSRLAHGKRLGAVNARILKLYERMEALLRHALVRLIEDRRFARIFRNDAEVRRRWPL